MIAGAAIMLNSAAENICILDHAAQLLGAVNNWNFSSRSRRDLLPSPNFEVDGTLIPTR